LAMRSMEDWSWGSMRETVWDVGGGVGDGRFKLQVQHLEL